MKNTTKTDTTKTIESKLVKDNPKVEAALRQAMKDFHGQPFLFDGQLDWTVEEAWNAIHAMQHCND